MTTEGGTVSRKETEVSIVEDKKRVGRRRPILQRKYLRTRKGWRTFMTKKVKR